MAEKTTTVKSVTKEEPAVKAAAAETKAPEGKEEAKKEAKKEAKAPAKKETVKKETAKKETAKKAAPKKTTARKTTAKKAVEKTEEKPEEKTAGRKAAKKAVTPVVHLQFGGRGYSMDDIQKMAFDVWKFDLQHEEEYTSLELYVKPEESRVYYVFNGDIAGSFGI